MTELLKKIDYALRKDSLSDAERIASARQLVSQGLSHPAPSGPEPTPTKEDFAKWARAWHDTCDTILTLLDLPGGGSPQEMLAQVQACAGPCPDCGRTVLVQKQAATGFIAKCGRRLTDISQCRAEGCPERKCTCHPDDSPPVPCAEKYAYSECEATRSAASTVEPVAWRYRFTTNVAGTEWSDWFIVDEARSIPHRASPIEVQPLYAAPTTSPEPDAVREALEPFAKYEMLVIGDPFSLKKGDLKDCDYVVGFAGPVQPEFRHFAAAKAALSRPAHGGWEDISTAPKDGQFILAIQAGGGHVPDTICWDGEWRNGMNDGMYFTPTHWMPIPAGPLARNDRGGPNA